LTNQVASGSDQPSRLGQRQADVAAENRFEADRNPDRLPSGAQQRLIAFAGEKVAHRNGHPMAEER